MVLIPILLLLRPQTHRRLQEVPQVPGPHSWSATVAHACSPEWTTTFPAVLLGSTSRRTRCAKLTSVTEEGTACIPWEPSTSMCCRWRWWMACVEHVLHWRCCCSLC